MSKPVLLWGCLVAVTLTLVANGETENKFAQILEKARKGDARAQAEVGKCYVRGEGVEKDFEQAFKWYSLSAEQGNAQGQNGLGNRYLNGEGVERDYGKALEMYRLSAAQGNADAQCKLGTMYAFGDGVVEDDYEAMRWYRMAAEQGSADGQYLIGKCCLEGIGIEKNIDQAIKWYKLAADKGSSDALAALGMLYKEGVFVEQNTDEAIRLLNRAREIYQWYDPWAAIGSHISALFTWVDAMEGEVSAQLRIGCFYDCGFFGFPVDKREAARWYRLAALQGDARAQKTIGTKYHFGEGTLEDFVEAYAWYILAAMNEDSFAKEFKEMLGRELSPSQIAAGQQRAKELQALIERKKVVSESDSDQPLSSDIAPSGFGSGLVVKGGYVLTCWHVVDGVERISVSFEGTDHVANIVQKDAANDIAILKVGDLDCGIQLNLSDGVKLGEKVFTLGYPHPDLQGSDVKFTTGSISGLTGPEKTPRYFQISAPLQAGNSGGPLFDEQGNLVGIVAAKLDSIATLALTGDLPQNVNYAIKAD